MALGCVRQVAYLEMLKGKGLELFAAYGNTTTDIRAYAAAGIPKVPLMLHHFLVCSSSCMHLKTVQFMPILTVDCMPS